MAKVTTIPATISRFTATPINEKKKRRTAAYARVSTDSEEQLTSYSAQVDYYTNYIKSRDDWEFVSVYTDEGITGTNTKHREGFKRMVADALAGKIDLIVTKSVSRFARNTVDSLTTVRQLKEKGVEIYFEKENIWTLDSKGELLITIMSSLAQEESRSISENCTWGQRKRFADGKVTVPFKRFLGYDRGPDGNLVLNKDEAVIIRRIYSMFLQGMTPHGIAARLTADGIKSPGGKDKWNAGAVRSILTNEKYKGDALLQKSYTVDFLTKKKKVNEGEIPQYYVEDTHPAIIDKATFDFVQEEMARRRELGALANKSLNTSCFTGKIKCPFCHKSYMHEVRTDRGYAEYWLCGSRKIKGGRCTVGGSINHKHLQETCAKVLGLQEFDEAVFLERVDVIYVPKRETLEFHLKDGTVVTEACKNTGHQDCWTEERRAATSLKRKNGKRPNRADMTCFSKVIKCVRCGCNFRKGTRTSANGDKVSHWRCSEHKGCNSVSLRDDLLRTMAAQVLSIDAFNEEEFEQRIDHIDVEEDRLEFYFRDGHSVTDHWPIPRRKKCQK